MTANAADFPPGVLLAYYGDDYTGSSAVMEATAFAGLGTVLFLDTPTPERLARFADHRVIGIAGVARSQSPAWMDRNLPPIFQLLRSIEAPISFYKVCSTFDSAPHVGSIGHAVDLAVPILGGRWLPLVVASPDMGRYQVFGHLFAVVDGVGYRLDRHPVMSRHPVTPMDEADLRLHLAKQTTKRIGLVDCMAMKRGQGDAALNRTLEAGSAIVSLDMIDDETLEEVGRLVWEHRGERLFAAGSQGLAYALVAYWRAAGLIERVEGGFRLPPVDRIVCVSGSVSPVTAAQIAFSEQHGFELIRVDGTRAIDAAEWEGEIERGAKLALGAIGRGRDPLVFTAAGPDDPAVAGLRTAVTTSGVTMEVVNDRIGVGLGQVLDCVMRKAKLTRAVISGGDTSGHAASALGIYALTALAPVAPGSPLCRAHADGSAHEGLEIALKGGQVGGPDFFCVAKAGGFEQ